MLFSKTLKTTFVAAALLFVTAPAMADAPKAELAPAEACKDKPKLMKVTIGADLLPWMGTSSISRGHDLRNVSINMLGFSGAVRGFEASHVGSINRYCVTGAQVSGAFNATGGAMTGAQVAGALNLNRGVVTGAQVAGAANVIKSDLTGVQVAGAANVNGGTLTGVQVGGAFNAARALKGVQVAGAANLSGDLTGVQIAGATNVALGTVNGVQIGVLNIAEKSDFSIGVLNIMYKGRTHIDVWGTESGFTHISLKNGGDHWHSIYTVGTHPFSGPGAFSYGLGIGGHFPLTDRVFLDLDGIHYGIKDDEVAWDELNMLSTVRLTAGIQLTDYLAVTAGASFNLFLTDKGDPGRYSLFGGHTIQSATSSDPGIHVWPGLHLGMQFL